MIFGGYFLGIVVPHPTKYVYLTYVMFVFQVSRFNIDKTVTRCCFEYVSPILRDIYWFFDRTFYNEYDQNIFKILVLVLPCQEYNNRKKLPKLYA